MSTPRLAVVGAFIATVACDRSSDPVLAIRPDPNESSSSTSSGSPSPDASPTPTSTPGGPTPLDVAEVNCVTEGDGLSYARKSYSGVAANEIASSVTVLWLYPNGPAAVAYSVRVTDGEIAAVCLGAATSARFIRRP